MSRNVSGGVPKADSNSRGEYGSFRRWLVALCAIRFDLEQGQVVEDCYPARALSSEEELDVAFSAFPDSMSQAHTRASIHDCVFFFRIRRRGTAANVAVASGVRRTASSPSPVAGGRRSSGGDSPEAFGIKPGDVTLSVAVPSRRHSRSVSAHEAAEGNWFQGLVKAGEDGSGRRLSRESSPGRRSDGRTPSPSSQLQPSSSSEAFIPRRASSGDISRLVGYDEVLGGNLPGSGALSSTLSPRPRVRDTTEVTTPESAGRKGYDENAAVIKDKGNGYWGGRGGPGSGGPRYLYGFVFNRQRQDERLKRGGEQKSVVILSERPYLCVFKPLVQILGPLYFDIGSQALEQIAALVAQWPAPLHGAQMELSVGSSVIKPHLPPAHTLPPGCGTPMDDFTSAMAPVAPLNKSVPQGIFHEADLFGMFRGMLMQLWVLWELLIVGEPLLLVAPTPSQCCEAIAALVGLVAPLPCSVDFRPYFTIHDPDFSGLNSLKEGEEAPPMLLGVTNLFFLKALKSLPHVISVGVSPSSSGRVKIMTRSNSQNGNKQARPLLQAQLSPLRKFSPINLLRVARVKKDGPLALMTEHREALWTSYGAATKADTSVLNRLVDAGTNSQAEESMAVVNNEILRRHFLELTTNFLAPFGPYLRATTPSDGRSPFSDPPPLPPFDAHEFIEGLAARGPGKFLSKRLRNNWLDLYRWVPE